MLIAPEVSVGDIATCLLDNYGLRAARSDFLPIGDANSAHYRVEARDGVAYFLKLRREDLDDVAVEVPAALDAAGIQHIMAPLATATGSLQLAAHGFHWILYPFVAGHNGFQVALSPAQWVALGETVRAVHATEVPSALRERVPKEEYAPRWRDRGREYQRAVETSHYDDPIAASLASYWSDRRDEIRTLVERAEDLGSALRERAVDYVLCHTDLHAGNVLLAEQGALYIVDWDNPLLAPKERDLMFICGGVGGIWNTPEEEAWFYQGYGATEIDLVALSYYRYERIVEDLAAFADEIFGMRGSVEDRTRALRLTEQFDPGAVVEIAHRTYARLR
jgi:spectinomycin phosphotransferase